MFMAMGLNFGKVMKTVKESAPLAVGLVLAPTVSNFLNRVPYMATPIYGNITVGDAVIVVGSSMFLKKKGMIGGVAKGVVVAVIAKALSGIVGSGLNSILGSGAAAADATNSGGANF